MEHLTTEPPGGLRYLESNESERGTSRMSLLPARSWMVRSLSIWPDSESQVSFLPLRTRMSMRIKVTQVAVTGRLMRMVSPRLKLAASATVSAVVPEGTYESEIGTGSPVRLM